MELSCGVEHHGNLGNCRFCWMSKTSGARCLRGCHLFLFLKESICYEFVNKYYLFGVPNAYFNIRSKHSKISGKETYLKHTIYHLRALHQPFCNLIRKGAVHSHLQHWLCPVELLWHPLPASLSDMYATPFFYLYPPEYPSTSSCTLSLLWAQSYSRLPPPLSLSCEEPFFCSCFTG